MSAEIEFLLIVPYGIETWKEVYSILFNRLLIVPYGIETWSKQDLSGIYRNF